VLLKYSRKLEKNTTHGRLRRLRAEIVKSGRSPRIKEILGFLKG